MKPYKRRFNSHEEVTAYFSSIGKLKLFGNNIDYWIYNFKHNNGKRYHVNIYPDGRVEYVEMSLVQNQYWNSQE